MDRLFAILIVGGLILTAIFVFRYLKVIPNYKNEYLLEFNTSKVILKLNIEKVNGIYQIHQLNERQYRVHFNESIEQLKKDLMTTLSLNTTDIEVKPIHSWLKTNAWK